MTSKRPRHIRLRFLTPVALGCVLLLLISFGALRFSRQRAADSTTSKVSRGTVMPAPPPASSEGVPAHEQTGKLSPESRRDLEALLAQVRAAAAANRPEAIVALLEPRLGQPWANDEQRLDAVIRLWLATQALKVRPPGLETLAQTAQSPNATLDELLTWADWLEADGRTKEEYDARVAAEKKTHSIRNLSRLTELAAQQKEWTAAADWSARLAVTVPPEQRPAFLLKRIEYFFAANNDEHALSAATLLTQGMAEVPAPAEYAGSALLHTGLLLATHHRPQEAIAAWTEALNRTDQPSLRRERLEFEIIRTRRALGQTQPVDRDRLRTLAAQAEATSLQRDARALLETW